MVIGLMIITAIPAVTGVSQAISGQKKRDEQELEDKRMKKFHIDIACDVDVLIVQRQIHEHRVVLRDERVWVGPKDIANPCPEGYVAESFFIEYPDNARKPVPIGMVSQTRAEPPLLNWIYVDTVTAELRYGNKSQSIEHLVGPWNWSDDETEVTLKKRQRCIAVQKPMSKKWQLYWDVENNGLAGYVPADWKKVYVTLKRTMMAVS
jgi:hypothetical protein